MYGNTKTRGSNKFHVLFVPASWCGGMEELMKAGAIFDMDGLLFDTELVYNKSWYDITEIYGYHLEPKMLDEMRGTNGTLMAEIVASYLPHVDAAKLIHEVFDQAKHYLSQNVPMKPGVIELLQYLKNQSVRLAVASSAPMDLIIHNLHLTDIKIYFDVVVSGDQVAHGKPAPDIFLLAASKLGLDAADCYVFEDGINGANAGICAGCSTIMVPDLLTPTPDLYRHCIGIYPDLYAVLEALKKGIC